MDKAPYSCIYSSISFRKFYTQRIAFEMINRMLNYFARFVCLVELYWLLCEWQILSPWDFVQNSVHIHFRNSFRLIRSSNLVDDSWCTTPDLHWRQTQKKNILQQTNLAQIGRKQKANEWKVNVYSEMVSTWFSVSYLLLILFIINFFLYI